MRRWVVGFGFLLLLLFPACVPSTIADESMKGSFKKMGKSIGQAGKEVGRSAAKAGKVLGRESQKIWYRGVKVSKPALEKAQLETRGAIQKSLDAMDRTIESLRRQLERLKKEDASRGDG